jgi:nucleolar protein 56
MPQDKSTLGEDKLEALADIVGDEDKARSVLEAAKTSMGQDISPIDLVNVEAFARWGPALRGAAWGVGFRL